MNRTRRARSALLLALLSLPAFFAAPARGAELAWAELLTSGVPAEMAPFYERCFGWTSERVGDGARGGVIFRRAGRPVAGVAYHAGERGGPWRARWVPFFSSSEPGAAAESVGARLLGEQHPGAAGGRVQWLAADPQGAIFGVIAPSSDGGTAEAAGSGFWPVLLTRPTPDAVEFYRRLLGASVADEPRTPLFAGDFLLVGEDGPWAGIQPAGVAGRPGWLLLVAVADIDAAVATARRAGARVLRAPGIDLIGGRVAVLSDPAGGVFGLREAIPLGEPGGGRRGAAVGFEVEALPR